MSPRNYTKPFSIGGIVLAEIYMFFTVLAPLRNGPPIPISVPMQPVAIPAGTAAPVAHRVLELLLLSPFFALFGALVGLGVGLLVTAILSKRQPPAQSPPPEGAR